MDDQIPAILFDVLSVGILKTYGFDNFVFIDLFSNSMDLALLE